MNPMGDVALTGRVWQLPRALPDDPSLIDLWVRLATARAFGSGENIEWLSPGELASLANDFHARTGQTWSQWAGAPRE